MATPIIQHELVSEATDDPTHPIPYLGTLDVMATKKDGGADLVIVVASPLMADERSQNRLLEKMEGYLSFISSDEFRSEAGSPNPDNTHLVVKLHPDSSPAIHDLLRRSESWVLKGNASLKVAILTSSELA
ncbi:hypothetical protein [Rhodanobacter sp. UC4451_H18]